ncbi:MAG: hypothetical protein AAGF11_04640 [Myxococcota bacterium]
MSTGGDWSDSLFKPEKGDSLGDGSWGRESEEPELAPVAWDKLPDAPAKDKARARLATPAPGSQKESGLLDIKQLAPDLAQGMKDTGAASSLLAQPGPLPATQGPLPGSEQESNKASSEGIPVRDSSASVQAGTRASAGDMPVVPNAGSSPIEVGDPPANRGPLLFVMGLLVAAAAGLAIYALTQ